jgi:hypothetical protein
MSVSKLAAVSAALLLVLGLPLAAGAKEEAKIQVLLVDDSNPSNGKGKGRSDGKMQSTFTEQQATFQVHVKQLIPGGSYELRARDLEATDPADGELIQAFTASSNGQVNLKIDLLQTGDAMNPPSDPRGKLISIYDPFLGEEVMSGWFYGDAVNDTPHTKVKEQTELDPVVETTEGSVSARYDMGPNGKGGLNLQLQNVAPDTTYEIHVEGAVNPIETLTTNSGGTAKLSLRTHPGKGKGSGKVKEHNKKGLLTIDPRRKLIEVKQGDVVVFSGPMLAQIPNLNDCGVGVETITPMLLDPGQVAGAGEVTTGVDESCDPIFGVAVSDLPAGDYALFVDDVDVSIGTPLTVADDGVGGTFGELRFDANPEASDPDELPLDFAVGSGSLVEVEQGATPFLSVTLP